MFPGLYGVTRKLWPSRAETWRKFQHFYKPTKYTNQNKVKQIIKHVSYRKPAPTCFGNKVPSSGSFSATKFRKTKSIPGENPTEYKQLFKQPSPGILLDTRNIFVGKNPWWWKLGAETCRCWHLIRSVFCLFYCILIKVFFVFSLNM
jgi:hypothetical protein